MLFFMKLIMVMMINMLKFRIVVIVMCEVVVNDIGSRLRKFVKKMNRKIVKM